MNDKILQLLVQSGLLINVSEYRVSELDPNIKKFAELIVQECLTQVDKVDAMLDDPKEKVGVSWVGLAIAKHWGLE